MRRRFGNLDSERDEGNVLDIWKWARKPALHEAGWYSLQSLTLDIEAVAAVVGIIETRRKELLDQAREDHIPTNSVPHLLDPARVVLMSSGVDVSERTVPLDDVPALPRAERTRLYIRGGLAEVNFRSGHRIGVWNDNGDIGRDISDYLLRTGTPRFEYRHAARFLPLIPLVALVISWVWFLVSYATPLPLAMSGSIMVFFAAAGARAWTRYLANRHTTDAGAYFRESSRQETRIRLANAKANVIVSTITIPIGIVLGFVIKTLIGDNS